MTVLWTARNSQSFGTKVTAVSVNFKTDDFFLHNLNL